MSNKCYHTAGQFDTQVRITHISDVDRFILEVRARCSNCHKQFQFVGLPEGAVNFEGACMSPGGLVAKLVMMPEGTYLPPIDDAPPSQLLPPPIPPAHPEDAGPYHGEILLPPPAPPDSGKASTMEGIIYRIPKEEPHEQGQSYTPTASGPGEMDPYIGFIPPEVNQ